MCFSCRRGRKSCKRKEIEKTAAIGCGLLFYRKFSIAIKIALSAYLSGIRLRVILIQSFKTARKLTSTSTNSLLMPVLVSLIIIFVLLYEPMSSWNKVFLIGVYSVIIFTPFPRICSAILAYFIYKQKGFDIF